MTVERAIREFVGDQRIDEGWHALSEVEVVPKGFKRSVTVRVYSHSTIDEMPYFFQTSHFAQTPMMAGPHIADDPWAESPAAAAKMALEGVLARLEEAIRAGHKPRDEWLLENPFWERR